MAPKVKLNLKDKVEDDEMDLSMCELQEVPVKDIAIYKKVYSLDLSNNLLTSLPKLFATLTNITKLDLSKNQLNSLPDNFGDLQKLRHLDLYKNNLEHLPLTFGKLKALKWLDLKDNPLVPAIKETAGLCIDGKECQACAKKIVNFYSKLSANIEEDLNTREKQREKDKQANDLAQQKEKQKEKKKNKKEKNKQKSDGNNGIVKETVGKTTVEQKTHSTNNNNNNKKTAEKNNITKATTTPHSFISMFMLCVQLFVITFFILFVLTAIKFPKTVFLETKVTENYQILVTSLPENYQNHAITLGKEIGRMHNVTGENFLKLFGHIKNFQENPVYTKVTDYLTDYVLEIKQFLGNDKTVHVEK